MVSLSEAAKEAAYLRSLMQEIGMEKYKEIILFVDNLGALYIVSDPVYHVRTKHINPMFIILFARESHLAS